MPEGTAKRALLRAEASVAMMRIVLDVPFIVVAGWFAAADGTWSLRLCFAILALMLAHGASNVINDIADLEQDQVTKSWMPLPSGIVDLRQAVVTLAVISAAVVGLVAAASASPQSFVAALALLVLGGLLVIAYSLMPGGRLALAVASVPYVLVALTGWTLAQRGGAEILAVVAGVWLYGVASQVHAAIRDVDTDADVGNRTVAVRYGPERSLVLAAACDVGANLAALAAAAAAGRLALVAPLAALSVGATAVAYRRAARRQASSALQGRFARVKSMRGLALVRYGALAALVAAFSPGGAAALCLAAAVTIPLLRRHERRVVGGGLRQRLFA